MSIDPLTGRTRRGTSNGNQRGSSYDVRARKHYLLVTYQSNEGEGICRCYRCGDLLDWFTMTVDRIVPGCIRTRAYPKGGTYVRANIRPACSGCNSETGGPLANSKQYQRFKVVRDV